MIRQRPASSRYTCPAGGAVAPAPWRLRHFEERLDAWLLRENPPEFQVFAALAWTLGRSEDPYRDADPADGVAGLWFATVPDTLSPEDQLITCAFWIDPVRRLVTCDLFAALSWPA